MKGQRLNVPKWIHSDLCAIHVEVEAVIPDEDPSEPCFEPNVVKYLDQLQELANAGDVEELEKHGTVYVRRSA
ncbi:MAG: hypothetical protein IT445_14935 [Phycisphaeraceae bacterium]|nr:hypothetical protein [Phycisphaeraceae bacterium]